MIRFSTTEEKFLQNLEECRIATSHNDIPHVKPVSYIYQNGLFYIATDYETRTFKNLKSNPNVALSIDVYKSNAHKAVIIQGKSVTIENGKEFLEIFGEFYKKFEWVKNDPWEENEAPFIKIIPKTKTSWGLE